MHLSRRSGGGGGSGCRRGGIGTGRCAHRPDMAMSVVDITQPPREGVRAPPRADQDTHTSPRPTRPDRRRRRWQAAETGVDGGGRQCCARDWWALADCCCTPLAPTLPPVAARGPPRLSHGRLTVTMHNGLKQRLSRARRLLWQREHMLSLSHGDNLMSSGCLCVSCWVCTTVVSQCCLGSAARLSHSPLARALSLTRTRTAATARRHRPLISNPVIIQKIAPRWAGGWAGGRAGAGLASVCLAVAHMPLGCCSLGRLRTPWVAVAAAAAPRCTVARASPSHHHTVLR